MTETMYLVESHVIRPSHRYYGELDRLCFLSKNLYNATLYAIRQHYFETKEYLKYPAVNKRFIAENQPDYRALPSKVSQNIQRQVDHDFKSFFALLDTKKNDNYDKKVHLPGYKERNGRNVVFYDKQALSFRREGYVRLIKSDIYIKTRVAKDKIVFVQIVPGRGHVKVMVGYKKELPKPAPNGRYASIDLGVNNLVTMASNVTSGLIVNGRPVKSINQYYHKRKAELTSIQDKGGDIGNAMERLSLKRNRKINDYLHKTSRMLVNHLASNQIKTLVIGYNKEWKQDISIGRRNNQTFVSIPFDRLVKQLEYKCALAGIEVVITEENYTSKCSFLDDENVCKHATYSGKRIKRGLFKASDGTLINADLNGALNILKKQILKQEAWNDQLWSDCVEVCARPGMSKVTIR